MVIWYRFDMFGMVIYAVVLQFSIVLYAYGVRLFWFNHTVSASKTPKYIRTCNLESFNFFIWHFIVIIMFVNSFFFFNFNGTRVVQMGWGWGHGCSPRLRIISTRPKILRVDGICKKKIWGLLCCIIKRFLNFSVGDVNSVRALAVSTRVRHPRFRAKLKVCRADRVVLLRQRSRFAC